MDFRSLHTIKTAENVHLHVELAGLPNRVFACAVDMGLMGALMGGMTLLFTLASAVRSSPELFKTAAPLVMFFIFFGYHWIQEWLWNGKTLGKKLFNIRVVRNNGQPIGFWEAFGRNLLRVVDVYLSGIGLLCMMFNRSEKRFGDFVAGTIVINDQPIAKPFRPGWDTANSTSDMPSTAETTGILTDTAISAIAALPAVPMTAEEQELLRAYLKRRKRLFQESRLTLASALCQYFSERLHRTVASEADLDALLFSETTEVT